MIIAYASKMFCSATKQRRLDIVKHCSIENLTSMMTTYSNVLIDNLVSLLRCLNLFKSTAKGLE